MPRNASQVYAVPVGTDGTPNTIIFSGKYNTFIHDVETDLNTPRPVVAGGTGSTSADGALVNLSAEKGAQLVTNWDSTVWMPGSFYAATTASGAAPVAGHAFAGVVVINEPLVSPPTNQNVVVEARDMTDPAHLTYYRIMTAGVWGPWLTARQSIYAAPFDALAYNGMQINGSMDVSQELGAGGSAGPLSNTSKCIVDGWTIQTSGTQAVSGQQNTAGIAAPGLPNTLAMYTNTANAAPAATAYANYVQSIEGYRVARLAWGTANAQPITIGFWFQAARTGLFSGAVINGASNRSYVFSFNYTTAGGPQYFTVTVPGDTTGTWAKGNTAGLVLLFAAMAGSTYQTAPNVWNGGLFLGATGTTNACQTTSDFIFITGVVVLPGLEAPSSARSALIMRPYDQELVLCKRYWNISFANFRAYAAAGGVIFSVSFTFPEMRIAPAGALLGSTGAANSTGINVNPFGPSSGFYGFQSVAGGDCYAGNSISLNARL